MHVFGPAFHTHDTLVGLRGAKFSLWSLYHTDSVFWPHAWTPLKVGRSCEVDPDNGQPPVSPSLSSISRPAVGSLWRRELGVCVRLTRPRSCSLPPARRLSPKKQGEHMVRREHANVWKKDRGHRGPGDGQKGIFRLLALRSLSLISL